MTARKYAKMPILPKAILRIRENLKKRFSKGQPLQTEDLATAYHTALSLSHEFRMLVKDFTECTNQKDLEWQCRPGNGVKSPARILEKAVKAPIPLDFLGGKVVATSLLRIYEIAIEVPKFFQVVDFKDRFETPQLSGYRDLQFQVKLAHGHIAELKIVHQRMDELDAIEHRIYEIVRMLHNKTMNESELRVYNSLSETSQKLYADTWKAILQSEVKP